MHKQTKMQHTPAEIAEATARNASELVLRKAMIHAGLEDRKHRDWCVISATGITDSWGFVALETGHGDIPELIHKRELHSRIGDKAETWWSKRLRLRRHRQ